MRLYYIRFILWSGALLFLAASAALAVFGLQSPPPPYSEANISRFPRSSSTLSDRTEGENLSLDLLVKIGSLPLRRPLYDPPEVIQKKPILKSKPCLSIELVGLINEPGHSRALLRTKEGKTRLLSVGETFSNEAGLIEVVSIDDASITVGYEGERITIELKTREHEKEIQ